VVVSAAGDGDGLAGRTTPAPGRAEGLRPEPEDRDERAVGAYGRGSHEFVKQSVVRILGEKKAGALNLRGPAGIRSEGGPNAPQVDRKDFEEMLRRFSAGS